MKEFIEKNRKFLKIYRIIVRIIGWVLILEGFIWLFLIIERIEAEGRPDFILNVLSSWLYDFFFLGLVALGIAQLVRYLIESEYKPGCILRNGDKIFYIYAVFLSAKTLWIYHLYKALYWEVIENNISQSLFVQPFLLPTLMKVLVLVGLGLLLRRVMPIIEESRTLV